MYIIHIIIFSFNIYLFVILALKLLLEMGMPACWLFRISPKELSSEMNQNRQCINWLIDEIISEKMNWNKKHKSCVTNAVWLRASAWGPLFQWHFLLHGMAFWDLKIEYSTVDHLWYPCDLTQKKMQIDGIWKTVVKD